MKITITINKKILKILNETYCVYLNGTKDSEIPTNCDECILREIEYTVCWKEWKHKGIEHREPVIRDLCFAIYHEKILGQE